MQAVTNRTVRKKRNTPAYISFVQETKASIHAQAAHFLEVGLPSSSSQPPPQRKGKKITGEKKHRLLHMPNTWYICMITKEVRLRQVKKGFWVRASEKEVHRLAAR